MVTLVNNDIVKFVESNIQKFHDKRLQSLRTLNLKTVMLRKNPYLFKAKNQNTAYEFVKTIVDAHLSSQEEGIFGGFLEQLAVYICGSIYGGRKSSAEGIDLEFQNSGIIYLVSIKSGPNWGNSRQIAKMKEDFRKAKRILGTNTKGLKVVAINGCCYGKDNRPDKGEYLKLCGQRFWEFISGDKNLYTKIIEPLGHKAKEKNEEFMLEYTKLINKFTFEFSKEYCDSDGSILWEKILQFNSSKNKNHQKPAIGPAQ